MNSIHQFNTLQEKRKECLENTVSETILTLEVRLPEYTTADLWHITQTSNKSVDTIVPSLCATRVFIH